MSRTSRLSDLYSRFFKGAGIFAVSPYVGAGTLLGYYCTGGHPTTEEEGKKYAVIVCIALTIIPVLPAFTAITASLALIGAAIAALSAILFYPVAGLLDCSVPEPHYNKV